MFVSSQNLVLAAATLASGVSALAETPVVNKLTIPKLGLSPIQSKIVCLKGEIALAVLTKLNYQTAAYSFCSSFISIPAATSSVTVTETSFTPTTTTVPVTATETVTLPEATVTVTITPAAIARRGVAYATPAVPFKSAIATIKSDLISAGCSCIRTKIPLATSTTTLTATITQASPTITAFSTVTETTTTQLTKTVTVTLPGAPDPSCDGAVCGAFRSCSATVGGCSCYTSAEGLGYCARDTFCDGLNSCTTSSDCAPAQVCAVNTCCGPQGICLNLQCNNPARKLMKHRRQTNGERTSRNDGSNSIGGVAA